MPYERDVEAPRRWWLGWLQLLFAWVLCMLLCANIALVLAEGLPAVRGEATVDRQAGCTATQTSSLRKAEQETRHEQRVDSTKASVPRC
ncbi:hypothetical protein J2W32_001025 [Variovorax boronicumulans]|uniref:Uncharacterized protein n=2 Tax=Variovorax TaxID=34072 RepID=A0AAW8CXC0_9BURK|nr:hypothetical protein [Variovorax boronicumulans]MDP9892531.1 hypothetical protein [Variovorax boronicumulans]MDQ0038224.1 hypothetical protein [Variovorax boronicumulans]MDQ0044884.1 hypothetical protein [Variovorax boronicumulans]MDQ0051989.1 hypothetical protein [Variovorax boronicumulans]